ncbi:MAG: FHA domain-containing protein [Planctomycetaceae bacterium]|nr:FHA domain-containing protein [Planctomycetaceae bacterium]
MDVKLVVSSGSRAGQAISINVPKFFIGRAEDCHLKPKSELISRYHCAIISEEGGYVAVRDMQSKNGVYINGERVFGEKEVKTGDKIVVGPLEFHFQISVSVQGEKKPKVESVKEAVVRTVEVALQPAVAAQEVKAGGGDDVTDWLMGDDDEVMETATVELNSVTDDLKELYSNATEPESVEPQQETPAAKPASASNNADSRDAAANLLKNFFKGGR